MCEKTHSKLTKFFNRIKKKPVKNRQRKNHEKMTNIPLGNLLV